MQTSPPRHTYGRRRPRHAPPRGRGPALPAGWSPTDTSSPTPLWQPRIRWADRRAGNGNGRTQRQGYVRGVPSTSIDSSYASRSWKLIWPALMRFNAHMAHSAAVPGSAPRLVCHLDSKERTENRISDVTVAGSTDLVSSNTFLSRSNCLPVGRVWTMLYFAFHLRRYCRPSEASVSWLSAAARSR